ncbi:MAG: DUF5668 domain-containing protein [Coriobacteriia bacterium]|nr:DUF5668 domain-containing protein [Coriobacteriia bacterium]
MSNSNEKQATTEFPEASGIGSVKVDGETTEVFGGTFKEGAQQSADSGTASSSATDNKSPFQEAVDTATDTARAATDTAKATKDSFKGGYYPQVSPWSKVNKWGIWFGVVLVSLGTLIFLDMLSGVVPALENIFGGYSFWRFWPVLIIFGGLALAFSPASDSPNPKRNGSFSPSRFMEGLFTVTVGIVFLGNSLGYVAWSSWPAMLSYWPLLLVIAGLAILSHGLKTEWFSVLAYLISILTLLAVASSMWIGEAPLIEPFVTLAEIGSYRGMDLFNIGTEVGNSLGTPR